MTGRRKKFLRRGRLTQGRRTRPLRRGLFSCLGGAPERLSFHFTSWRQRKRSRDEQHARSSERGRDGGCGFLPLLFSQPLASERRGRRSRASPAPRDEHFAALSSPTSALSVCVVTSVAFGTSCARRRRYYTVFAFVQPPSWREPLRRAAPGHGKRCG